MKIHLHFVMILATLIGSAPIVAFAGGNTEVESTPSEQSSQVSPDASESRDPDAIEQRMRELLGEIGIRTFDERIAAVDFGVPSLAGDETSLSDFSGEFVFLNFWATWCPPCREEMPSMEVLHKELSDYPFRILAIDVQEGSQTVREFVNEFGFTFPILLDESGRVASNYGVRGLPTTYFISPEGIVLGMLVGTRYWDEPETLSTMREIAEIAQTAGD